ncbi:hypothetical protein K1T71_014460 [Dendrolimus kikuchii]|uniref:Uncharacterized protein n=1 Tax=Dendrolimus kikuchii TaxID=765133 RepID=A0ACC1CEH0_9NEOP|nr:hypothetical protein K1T71_014460 [Dendrolimus kikuchii]
MKLNKEWFIPAPWGKIAALSYGNISGDPILMVHGRQDSAATFIPLLELMPNNYHYVAIDMPGNGRSDPFPISVKLSRFHFVAAVEYVLLYLKWDKFIYIGHSMGCEQALFYNTVYPNHIIKMIFLDLTPSLQRLQYLQEPDHYKRYSDYYNDYDFVNNNKKVYTKEQAVEVVMRARDLTQKQAELILSRNLIEVDKDRYMLSWDRRLRYIVPQHYPNDYYYKLFTKKSPPILHICANEGSKNYPSKLKEAKELLNWLEKGLKYFKVIYVDGGHDVHFTNPERCAQHIVEFLNCEFEKSKL